MINNFPDFEGNLIERPEGVTKRYTRSRSTHDPAMLGGLRNDGTPIITSNMGEHTRVYVIPEGTSVNYRIIDQSGIEISPPSAKVRTSKLDHLFSERLIYRVGEALKHSPSSHSDDEKSEQLEATYKQMNQQLGRTLEEAEQSQNGEIPDPRTVLQKSIEQTKQQIAEKERISNVATSDMSDEDLKQHFASLKRLRANLAAMQYKLDKLGADEREQAEAKGKLPEVHQRWAAMPLESKQRFIRAATSRISLDELCAGWIKLTIEWSPLLGGDVIDEAYIWSYAGKRWTEEEKNLLREHYATAERGWLMEQLPERSWESIITKAPLLGAERSKLLGYRTGKSTDVVPSTKLSVSDWQLTLSYEIPIEIMLEKRVYWKEYVSLPLKSNSEEMCAHR